jgi:hypothetical protein
MVRKRSVALKAASRLNAVLTVAARLVVALLPPDARTAHPAGTLLVRATSRGRNRKVVVAQRVWLNVGHRAASVNRWQPSRSLMVACLHQRQMHRAKTSLIKIARHKTVPRHVKAGGEMIGVHAISHRVPPQVVPLAISRTWLAGRA